MQTNSRAKMPMTISASSNTANASTLSARPNTPVHALRLHRPSLKGKCLGLVLIVRYYFLATSPRHSNAATRASDWPVNLIDSTDTYWKIVECIRPSRPQGLSNPAGFLRLFSAGLSQKQSWVLGMSDRRAAHVSDRPM